MKRVVYLNILTFVVSTLLLFVAFYISPTVTKAQVCNTSNCNCNLCKLPSGSPAPCTADCESVYSSAAQGFVDQCFTTCNAASNVTQCPDTSWTTWGPCGGGYQERYCMTPSEVNDIQIQLCEPTGPSGTPTPALLLHQVVLQLLQQR